MFCSIELEFKAPGPIERPLDVESLIWHNVPIRQKGNLAIASSPYMQSQNNDGVF